MGGVLEEKRKEGKVSGRGLCGAKKEGIGGKRGEKKRENESAGEEFGVRKGRNGGSCRKGRKITGTKATKRKGRERTFNQERKKRESE